MPRLLAAVLLCALIAHSLADEDEGVTWSTRAEGADGMEAHVPAFPDGLDASNQQSLLMWAISNSNPELLHRTAASSEPDSSFSLEEKRERVKQLREIMDKQGQVSETELIKDIIKRLTEAQDVARDLSSLLPLVESIDNANDLKPLGALKYLSEYIVSTDEAVRSAAASVIGKAASNNAKFKQDLVDADPLIIRNLIQMTREAIEQNDQSTAYQGLYAIGSMSAVNHYQTTLHELYDLLSLSLEPQRAIKLKRKALTLISDFNELGLRMEVTRRDRIAGLISEGIENAEDEDFIEKCLQAVNSLVSRDQDWTQRFDLYHLRSKIRRLEVKLHGEEDDDLLVLVRDTLVALIPDGGKEI